MQFGLSGDMTDKERVFSNLIDEKLDMLRGVAGRIVGNAADADEAVQEALLKAWDRFGDFRSEAKLSSWVCRIAVNEAYNLLRKRGRDRRKLDALMRGGEGPECGGGEDEEAVAERVAALRRAIGSLPEIYRQTVELVLLEEVDTEEAALRLDCSANTLYWRVHKAKQLLRKALHEVWK